MVGHGGSSARSYLADPTSPIPSHCASIVTTSTSGVKSFGNFYRANAPVWLSTLPCVWSHKHFRPTFRIKQFALKPSHFIFLHAKAYNTRPCTDHSQVEISSCPMTFPHNTIHTRQIVGTYWSPIVMHALSIKATLALLTSSSNINFHMWYIWVFFESHTVNQQILACYYIWRIWQIAYFR